MEAGQRKLHGRRSLTVHRVRELLNGCMI
jgi:hypothetical protein